MWPALVACPRGVPHACAHGGGAPRSSGAVLVAERADRSTRAASKRAPSTFAHAHGPPRGRAATIASVLGLHATVQSRYSSAPWRSKIRRAPSSRGSRTLDCGVGAASWRDGRVSRPWLTGGG